MTEEASSPPAGIEVEYRAMRDEILARINMRQQIIAVTLTLGGAFLAVGIKQPAIALVYPPLAAFLALAWAQNDYRVRDLAKYIREEVEPKLPGVRWESKIHTRRSDKSLGAWRFVVLSHGGVFLFTQATALFVGIVGVFGDPSGQTSATRVIAVTLAVLDLLALVLVIRIAFRAGRIDQAAAPGKANPPRQTGA